MRTDSPHPTYPFQKEQRAAVLRAIQEGATDASIRAIKRHWDQRRDEEYPGWLEQYNRDVEAWANQQGASSAA